MLRGNRYVRRRKALLEEKRENRNIILKKTIRRCE
jgi:hypothetical protein